ncbi:hypothetical protein RRG08_033072 [Elysia crispata]|uniref:Uncharacterized protein n=1 Tax=Elysia crispata TaxID=231223 RepID=A0AAE1DTF7_9GAST|nr:hypothetical protein RRG08_033072 [Elysia crispata]
MSPKKPGRNPLRQGKLDYKISSVTSEYRHRIDYLAQSKERNRCAIVVELCSQEGQSPCRCVNVIIMA